MSFPGCHADRTGAKYVITGAPLDISTTFAPGARFGPDRVRHYAETFDDYDQRTNSKFSELAVHDMGNVNAWDDPQAYLEHLSQVISGVVTEDAVPVIIGGEHTVTLSGIWAVEPAVLVTVDAHLDLRDEYDGNPLSHACTARRAIDGGPGEKSPAIDELVVIGARTGNESEYRRAGADDVTVVSPDDVGEWTPSFENKSVYLSIDIDAVDPGFAPGTGTMEPFGLDPWSVRKIVRRVAPVTTGFDVVEVNDRDHGESASLAAKLIRTFIYEHAAATEGYDHAHAG